MRLFYNEMINQLQNNLHMKYVFINFAFENIYNFI